jgi:hypothetical protein
MKIYFEDGDLVNSLLLSVHIDYKVDAARGVSYNIEQLDLLNENQPGVVIYTNSIFAFNNRYAWNEELKAPEIFIRAGESGKWVRIDKLTNRELRRAHNLAHMYVAGEFERLRSTYEN